MQRKIGIQLRGSGRALKPRGPGVMRPKPQDRYGQPFKPKPIRPGKKDGGMLKPVKPSQKGLSKLPKDVRNKMGYMAKGGQVDDKTKAKKPLGKKLKKPKPGSYDYQLQETLKPSYRKRTPMKKGGFPDLSGDGKVTKKDILMGRGVIKRKK
tara:strand:- start:113 stop:568 length:456 start_codon:yes stop_codon:yes gene_type:complete